MQPQLRAENPPRFLVIDNFFENPDEVRQIALGCPKREDKRYWKGRRSVAIPHEEISHIKERFEELLQYSITKEFRSHYHVHNAEDPLVFHSDHLRWAAVVYLTPDAPPEAGTSFWKHKETGLRGVATEEDLKRTGKTAKELEDATYARSVLDKTKWQNIDQIGNVYNRCIIFDGRLAHSVSCYFGHDESDQRLVQLFFFE